MILRRLLVGEQRPDDRPRVSIAPAYAKKANSFARLFAHSLADSGIDVRDFSWELRELCAARAIVLHWPTVFFSPPRGRENLRTRIKLNRLRLARSVGGARLVWVAHNVSPHDKPARPSGITDAFLRLLDGVIYLSDASQAEVLRHHPRLADVPGLVTVHGHYLSEATAPPTPPRSPHPTAHLLFFGQVRPYKNVDRLIRCAKDLTDEAVTISIVGYCPDKLLASELKEIALGNPNVRIDIRAEPIPDHELEAVVDASDAVVLPYRDVLNSGSALYALSRNRPVLAARLGSLPELQEKVGARWLHLYEGEFSAGVLIDFVRARRTHALPPAPDLSSFGWRKIGQDVAGFLISLCRGETAGHQDR